VLESYGYAVVLARTATEALELAEKHEASISLLLTDVVMRGMTGRELAERLRSTRPGLKVLLTSGYSDDTLFRHGLAAGRNDFIEKPYVPAQLALKVREVLDA
jgi:two-component system, cell cycle sensor histidine kinase and response regulator CckA